MVDSYDEKDTKVVEKVHVDVLAISDENKTQDVWGDLEEGGPNYRALGWVRASVLLMKIQIGLGVLAIVGGYLPG